MIKICHLVFLVVCDLAVSVQILLFLNKKKKHKAKDNTRYLIDAQTKFGVLARQKTQRGGGVFLRTPSVVKMQPKCIGQEEGPPTYTQSLFPGLTHNASVHHQYARTSSVEWGEGGTAKYLNRGFSSVPCFLEVPSTMSVPHVKLKRSAQRRTS